MTDKFYTIPSVALHCLDVVGSKYPWDRWALIIEPSAGNGHFFTQIPSERKLGMDIVPEHDAIVEQDFFSYTPPPRIPKEKILVVGNPPFGRVSSLAVKFFNHAASWCQVIAFIVPRTFRRVSLQNRLCASFHLQWDEDIPTHPCAFVPKMMVKCCFQIWERSDTPRERIEWPLHHADWEFLPFGPKDERGQPTPPTDADFALRAYGGSCGDIVTGLELQTLRPKSWHWIRSHMDPTLLIDRFRALDYSGSENTARQNSLGRAELVQAYTLRFG